VTAGPTHEPIDAVRYLGNRSSGRLGIAVAEAAAGRGWDTTLLLGPTGLVPSDSRVKVARFRTAGDLGALLGSHAGEADVLVMAAAVADFRPRDANAAKLRRSSGGLTLDLESTPDLLAGVASRRREGQMIVGFALEQREAMVDSAREKLARKGADFIVANPIETLDSASIDPVLIARDGTERRPGAMTKAAFAEWLLDRIAEARA
jgi:phosphopantothenoylcysteine decarboxylase/phosphopantothenate--cysteine ligase